MTPDADIEAAVTADTKLSTHPLYGDSDAIERRVFARYELGLEVLGRRLARLPPAMKDVEAWSESKRRRLFRDPAVQLAIETALNRLAAGALGASDPLEALLARAVSSVSGERDVGISESLVSGSSRVSPYDFWLGSFDRHESDDPLILPLKENVHAALAWRERARSFEPDRKTVERIRRACSLLTKLLPGTGTSALRHIGAMTVVEAASEEGKLRSASGGDEIPSTVLISPHYLESPWEAAGYIFHEALHLKLFDVTRTRALLHAPEIVVDIPWRKVKFSLIRSLFSYHVYVHVMLLKAAVQRIGPQLFEVFGAPSDYAEQAHALSPVNDGAGKEYGDALDRARYIGERLEGPWDEHLTEDGRALVRWMNESIERVEPEIRRSRSRESPICYCKVDDLTVKPLPELGDLVVFTPERAKIHYLNTKAWLMFELCERATADEIARAYAGAVPELRHEAALHEVRVGLKSLVDNGVVRELRSDHSRASE